MTRIKALSIFAVFALMIAGLSTFVNVSFDVPFARAQQNSQCDYRADILTGRMDFYFDETTSAEMIARPALILAVHSDTRPSTFIEIKRIDEFGPKDLVCWVGGQEQFWSPVDEQLGRAWVYNSSGHDPAEFRVQAGRLDLGEYQITAEYGHVYRTHGATWRPISRDNEQFPLKPFPPVQGDPVPTEPTPTPGPPDWDKDGNGIPDYCHQDANALAAAMQQPTVAKFLEKLDDRQWFLNADKRYEVTVPDGYKIDFEEPPGSGTTLTARPGDRPNVQWASIWCLMPDEQ